MFPSNSGSDRTKAWHLHLPSPCLGCPELVHRGKSPTLSLRPVMAAKRLFCLCTRLREERMGGQTPCNQRMELMPLTGTCCLPFLPLGTLQAKDFKKRCMQMKLTQTDVRGSEDCLYLNIWIPQGKKQSMCLAGTWAGHSHLPFVHRLLWSISQQFCAIVGRC